MKMQMKITLCFWLCLSLAFVVLLGVVQTKTSDLSASITQDLTNQLVASKASEIGSWFGRGISQMRIVSEHEGIQKLGDDAILNYLAKVGAAVENEHGSVDTALALVDASGFGWIDRQHSVDLYDRAWFQSAMASPGEYYLSLPATSPIDGAHAIMISHPLRTDGAAYGCLVGSLAVEKLEAVLSTIRVFDGAVWMMNAEGRLIASRGEQAAKSPRDPRGFSLKALAKELSASEGFRRLRLADGSIGYLTYTSIPYTPQWMLCVLTSEGAMYGETRSVEASIIITWLCVLVVAIGVCMALAASLTRPLARLRHAMNAVNDGELANAYQPVGHDEVAALGRSFNDMLRRIRELIANLSAREEEKRAAELRALQAQINPHFIYNTLDTLKWKALSYQAFEVVDLTEALSSFFRISLSEGRAMIPLGQEVEHTYHYLFIQQVRYANRLSFDIDAEPALEALPVPKLILQPLVENALQHGIKPVSYKGHVGVLIRAQEGRLLIRVDDNGAGMERERLLALRQSLQRVDASVGYGLYNINARLRAVYQADYEFAVDSEAGKGTVVTLWLPLTAAAIPEEGGASDGQGADC